MYVDLHHVIDVAPFLALLDAIDLAPGPGGSRITWVGPMTVGPFQGRGGFVVLQPSCQIVGHCDPPIPGRRLHMPLVVNDGCWVFHAGTWQQLEIGHAYAMDPTDVHGAVNWGPSRRIHLMVDVEG